MKDAGQGASLSLTWGTSHSDSLSTQTSNTGVGSTISAGGNVSIVATGAGQDSNLLIQGSDVTAGGNVRLKADNAVSLLASQNATSERSHNDSSSASFGVAVSVSSNGGPAFGVTASASQGSGHSNGDDLSNTNTHVTAGKTLTIESGGDTTLQGAVVSGKQVAATVGGNLNLESLQDTSVYDSKQQNIGGSVTVGYGASASLSYSDSKVNGDYASVYGSLESFTQLVTGRATMTGEEVNRFWAAVGLIPIVGGVIRETGVPLIKLIPDVAKALGTDSKIAKEGEKAAGGSGGLATNGAVTSEGTANAATGAKLADDLASQMAKPQVSNPELSGLMDDLYRDNAKIGTGSTADAVRYEVASEDSVGGKLHTQKAQQYSTALQNWLDANPNASFSDRSAAQNVLRDLQNALMGK